VRKARGEGAAKKEGLVGSTQVADGRGGVQGEEVVGRKRRGEVLRRELAGVPLD
jgi:hypothetical protein